MARRGPKGRGQRSKTPRAAAFRVLNRVFSGAYADIVLPGEGEGLSVIDRALATELVYGVLRWWIRLDWIIDSFSAIKTKKMETRVLNALRLGVYQLYFLTRIPPSAAVNESVALLSGAGKKKAGFVNAVLRRAAAGEEVIYLDYKKDPLKHISVFYSHPQWMVRRWAERYGHDEALKLAGALVTVPPRTIRVNTLVTTRDGLLKELRAEGLDVKKTEYSPDGMVVREGVTSPKDSRFYIQDEASQLVVRLLAPQPGERVLEACAAPGGKTTHMAELMGNRGQIYAVDKYSGRLRTLEELAGRLGVKIVRTVHADAERPGFLKTEAEGSFDAVLVDAPCSGLGVLRRSPDIKIKRCEADIRALAAVQKRLLLNASDYLKPGGRLVYSVCTFEPEETDGVINGFLARRADFALEDAGIFLKGRQKGLAGGDGFLRTYPHLHSMDGFFAARLKRRG